MAYISSTDVWPYWVESTSTTTNTVCTSTIWATWTSITTSPTTCATSTVWDSWITSTSNIYIAQPVTTEAERAETARAAEEARVAWELQRAEQEKLRVEAEARAEALFLENISLRHRLEYEKHKHIVVHGRTARYRIRNGRSGNIDVINKEGFISHRLCAHPGIFVPNFDTMLAQKLQIECNEEAFVQVANRHTAFERERVLEPLH